MIEAILQLTRPATDGAPTKNRLLCVTPSNHSADVLVARLASQKSDRQLIRINASRRHERVNIAHLKYSR